MKNHYLERLSKAGKDAGHAGKKSEKITAKRLGGKLQPGSGAILGFKGDIVLPEFLVEAKSTVKYSITIQHEWLAKISHEAEGYGKQPAVAVTFTHSNGTPCNAGSWVMIPERVWKELLDDLQICKDRLGNQQKA